PRGRRPLRARHHGRHPRQQRAEVGRNPPQRGRLPSDRRAHRRYPSAGRTGDAVTRLAFSSLRLLAVALTALSLPLFAQEAGAPRENEATTIAKCLAELQSPDAGVRRRAVLVLSKYTSPQAVQGILQALKDNDPEIRQSAVVALIENNLQAQSSRELL